MSSLDWELLRRFLSPERAEQFESWWKGYAPHAFIAAHPIFTCLIAVIAVVYWVIGNPVADGLKTLALILRLLISVWEASVPVSIRSFLDAYPSVRGLLGFVVVALVWISLTQGLGNFISDDLWPMVRGLRSGISPASSEFTAGLKAIWSYLRKPIRDILVGLFTNILFYILVALGVIGYIVAHLLNLA